MPRLHVKAICFLFIYLFFLILSSTTLKAQNEKKYFAAAEKLFEDGDYYNAIFNYKKALSIDTADNYINYRIAECSWKINNHRQAESYFEMVYKVDKDAKFPETSFWLGMCKKSNAKYPEAKRLFERYYKKHKKQKSYFTLKAKQEIEACTYAQILSLHPLDLTIVHLDTTINSVHSEFSPSPIDSSAFLFSSSKGKFIYQYKGREVLSDREATLLQELNLQEVNTANLSFNINNDCVYYTQCNIAENGSSSCGIYLRRYQDGKWSAAELLPAEINAAGSNNTQPNIAWVDSLGEVLFFASDREGGEGKLDIYAVVLSENSTFGKPFNLGKKVNTIDNEITPYFCSPCRTLFFSSDWHKGLGGFDIFESRFTKGKFSEPENLGCPINSAQNDLYFIKTKDYSKAYFSSNRFGSYYLKNETCCNDIYSFDLPKPKKEDSLVSKLEKVDSAKIFLTEMRLLMPLTLYFHNDEPNKKTLDTCTKLNYKNTYFDYIAMREEYEKEYSKGLRRDDKIKAIKHIDEMFEDSIVRGYHNLERFAELLEKLLKMGENVNVILKGYCSPLASTAYNVNLAKRRVCSVQNYFFEYRDGLFMPKVQGRNLVFGEEDIGELKAKSTTSDNYYDTRNSIFNPGAALERKIQIIDFKTQDGVFELK